jgi:2-polyprenyl-6-methoxyphenol hydroxylase-like FAD-dependent oxidoreductase
VVIVGGGLSGALAAVVLGRAGRRVVLVDLRATHPVAFRVEKLAGDQVELLRRLGVIDAIAAEATRFDEIINVYRGKILDRSESEHYSILYQDIVRVVRAQIPESVDVRIGRVAEVETGPATQRVRLASGEVVEARLVILATGLGDALREKLGIRRRVIFDRHSVNFGFNMAPAPGKRFDFPALTYYGENVADRVDYLTVMPLGDVMRANLFTFRDHRDPWAHGFRREPREKLFEVMPGLRPFLGEFEIVGPVQLGLMDLYGIDNHVRDGLVVIGDAFQTSCPAAGTGVSRLLVDVDRLCNVHLPRWFATPGMEARKIARFYEDPVKQAADTRAARMARHRRSISVETTLRWEARRRQHYLRRRLLGWIRQFSQDKRAA